MDLNGREVEEEEKRKSARVAMLSRFFFMRKGFSGTPETKRQHASAWPTQSLTPWHGRPATAVGVVTVNHTCSMSRGDRLGEIGELSVQPDARRGGIGDCLDRAATAKCSELGCYAGSVTDTQEGEARHGLPSFYRRFGFVGSGEA